ncbi:lipoprotein [Spiroplasma endosymbiont of Seladonia tumulorum]|uniref:lipoprotein n=1 Tax=Spiroplasma endosymbiont of Seladonia tumulorum TaxID=3066321 RepID=UPI0030CC40BD
MKKILSLLGTITLIATSTTSLVACNTPQEYTPEELEKLKKENQINTTDETIKNNLEWIEPQEKPFNTVNNKWYYVVWKGENKYHLNKFKNIVHNDEIIINDGTNHFYLRLDVDLNLLYVYETYQGKETKFHYWKNKNNDYIKFVYRWNGEEQNLPDLIVVNDGNVKVNGE